MLVKFLLTLMSKFIQALLTTTITSQRRELFAWSSKCKEMKGEKN